MCLGARFLPRQSLEKLFSVSIGSKFQLETDMSDPQIRNDNDDLEPLLTEIDDDEIESPDYFDKIKKRHFDAGVPVTYPVSDVRDNDYYIIEYPDGKKLTVHESELGKE